MNSVCTLITDSTGLPDGLDVKSEENGGITDGLLGFWNEQLYRLV